MNVLHMGPKVHEVHHRPLISVAFPECILVVDAEQRRVIKLELFWTTDKTDSRHDQEADTIGFIEFGV